ncbi:MAG TPA: RNase adapter RapZ [Desulfomicrobiaceae bacterium]|nr:RNase adapter RapZ [Desulfomicrobiaceae bacterium]
MVDSFPVVIVSGLSGSGKSTALNVFEDLGFFCVDGIPAKLVPSLASMFAKERTEGYTGLAVGMDLRQDNLMEHWSQVLQELEHQGMCPQVVYIESSNQILMRRYASTRRPHPLESKRLSLESALTRERELLEPVRALADFVIDTSHFSVHDLRRTLQEKWTSLIHARKGLKVHLISFGFKYGVPSEADIVQDLRFLPNPYFDERLRPFSGKDDEVREFVYQHDTGQEFLARLIDFFLFSLPLYEAEGRYRLTIALGCTGGRHRSVATTEAVHAALKQEGYPVSIEHRHMDLG